MVKLTVKYDMDWQKISSRRRYDSSSGHAFIIVRISTGVIGMVLYQKACQKCDSDNKNGEYTEENDLSKNFKGSSKSMEADEILNMVEDSFHHGCFTIDVIVRNDDSTM